MKKFFFLCTFLMLALFSTAQVNIDSFPELIDPVETSPILKIDSCLAIKDRDKCQMCSDKALMHFLAKNVRYPSCQIVDGVVYISVIIDTTGKMEDIKIIKSRNLNEFFEEAALKAVYLLKEQMEWVPASVGGNIIKAKKIIPIRFKLM